MIAGVGSCGSWEDPCSLDQWDPSIPWCGHVLLMKGVFLDPNLGPRFEMAQIREFLSRSAWSAVQGIEANVDVDDVDVDVCRGQSMTEYDLHVRGCSSLLWHGSNLLHCPNHRWRPWSFQNSTIQVWVVSTDEDSNTASPDTFDGSSSIYI